MADRPTLAEIISVNNEWLPGIAEYSLTLEDIDGEGSSRSESGTMHREVVRPNVIHASVTQIVDQEELIASCQAIKGDAQVEMTVFCPGVDDEDVYITADFYVSKLDTQLLRYHDGDWWRLSYTIVQI